ncbi:MAG: transposase [Peptococcaceae bacterium]|jgi:putative transposase|nr:transposase [Peptococcaceae bacterium]
MDTRKMAKEYRLSQWAQIIQARKESGKSVKDFCAEEGVNKNAYFYWQRKLREAACKDLTEAEQSKGIVPGGWVRLGPVKPQYADGSILIEINGCQITVKSNTDLELLKSICSVLRSL